MSKKKIKTDEVVLNIFRELAGDRADFLPGNIHNQKTQLAFADALKTNFPESVANDIAFHLVDWNSDAAFILAMHLFPERFTKQQIREGIFRFLSHAPNHIAAAAKLANQPIEDIFEVGALDGNPGE